MIVRRPQRQHRRVLPLLLPRLEFHLDGKLRAIPMMESGYDGTRLTQGQPRLQHEAAARVESYRGFVFASLAGRRADAEGVPRAKRSVAFDDMCDRAPEGEVEVVPNCFRVIQHSNWKIFLENQLDALHPSVTHQSTGRAAARGREGRSAKKARPARRSSYHMLSAFATVTIDKWDSVPDHQLSRTAIASSPATWACGRRIPDTLAYDKVMTEGLRPEAHRGDRRRQHPPRAASIPASRCSRRCSSCAPCARSASTGR